MGATLRQILTFARITMKDPRLSAQMVLRNIPSRAQMTEAAILIVVLGVLLSGLQAVLVGHDENGTAVAISPFGIGMFQLVVLAVMVAATFQIGRAFGGTGTFEGAFALQLWLQSFALILQAITLFFVLVFGLPVLLIALISAVISTWVFVHFLSELHGFKSLWAVFGGVLASYFALSLVITFGLSVMGLAPVGM